MTTNVFLVPCDPGNFDRTVLSPVNMTEISSPPDPLADLTSVRFWGARDGERNKSYFEKMNRGDLVLFYQDGAYVGLGNVGRTFEDEEKWASTTFWQNAPSKLIYTIEEFTELSIPRGAVNRLFDYGPDYYPQGLTRVADNRVSNTVRTIRRALEMYNEKH